MSDTFDKQPNSQLPTGPVVDKGGSRPETRLDNLPQRGYTIEQLAAYIKRQLGSPVWNVEITQQQIMDGIQDALQEWSTYKPLPRYGSFALSKSTTAYLVGKDMELGITQVWFVEPNPVPTEIFYGNLIDPAPLFRTGLDEYDTFLRWRKLWQRVTSIQPDWLYDEANQQLLIHNPIERYYASIEWHTYYKDTTTLPFVGAKWVKEYALAKARYNYGDLLNKYSGAVPGPVKDLQLDGAGKRTEGEKQMEKLITQLHNMQDSAPLTVD